jgi:hypothetical protein
VLKATPRPHQGGGMTMYWQKIFHDGSAEENSEN